MKNINWRLEKIPGPIAIFGAGGFIGFNLLQYVLSYRKDVFGVFSDPRKNWRLQKKHTPPQHVVKCNLLDGGEVRSIISRRHPQTVFNLAAYGAYSTQQEINRIYLVNFNAIYTLIEELKKQGFSAFIQAGSQSEYGLNCIAPEEMDELSPNSHYAVSKTAAAYLVKYYGKVEKLPVVHLRLYSIYGPWEEPNRLIPTLIREAKKGRLPALVNSYISRDFVYVDDVVELLLTSANMLIKTKTKFYSLYGEVFNVCTGEKTTIRQLAYLVKKIFKVKSEPKFGTMKNRAWDLKDWVGNPKKINKIIGWKARTTLKAGLQKLYE